MFVKQDVPFQEEVITWPTHSGASAEAELVSGPLFQLGGRFPHLHALRLKVSRLLNVFHLPRSAILFPVSQALPLLRMPARVCLFADR